MIGGIRPHCEAVVASTYHTHCETLRLFFSEHLDMSWRVRSESITLASIPSPSMGCVTTLIIETGTRDTSKSEVPICLSTTSESTR